MIGLPVSGCRPTSRGSDSSLQRVLQLDGVGVDALRDGGALGLLVLAALAELHVGAEAARAQRDRQARLGIVAEQLAVGRRGLGRAVGLGELARVAAVGIARAADEGAVLAADLEAQAPFAAVGAQARIAALGLGREDVRAQDLVQRLQHLADAQVLDLADRAHELAPEVAQHVLPLELAVGDEVELLLEVGREVVLDVALEEALQERRDQPALVLGDQPLLVDADVVALLQHGERGGIGGGPADAQLLHALDQRRLGEARRRLGEVLLGLDAAVLQRVALGERRQAAAVVLLGSSSALPLRARSSRPSS